MFLHLFLHSQGAESEIILPVPRGLCITCLTSEVKPFSEAEPLLYHLLFTLSLLIAACVSFSWVSYPAS